MHSKRDEPIMIRHNAAFDTLWTEAPSNSLCPAAKHSGRFCAGSRHLEDEGPGIPAKSVWQETFVSRLAGELEWVERILAFLRLQDLSRFVVFQTMKNWSAHKSQTPNRSHYLLKKASARIQGSRRPTQTIFRGEIRHNNVPFHVKERIKIPQGTFSFIWSFTYSKHWHKNSVCTALIWNVSLFKHYSEK